MSDYNPTADETFTKSKDCDHDFVMVRHQNENYAWNKIECSKCKAECDHNEDKRESRSGDCGICSSCGDHAEFEECTDCGEELGSSCCGADEVNIDYDFDRDR